MAKHVVLIGLMAVLFFACSKKQSFLVRVYGNELSCTIEAEGRRVTPNELLILARSRLEQFSSASVDGDSKATPYRCLSEAISTLQRAGFVQIGFIAEPPTVRNR